MKGKLLTALRAAMSTPDKTIQCQFTARDLGLVIGIIMGCPALILEPAAGFDSLSPTEKRVLEMLGTMSVKEIAHKVGRSIKTIETQRAQISRKLGLNDGRSRTVIDFAVKLNQAGFFKDLKPEDEAALQNVMLEITGKLSV